MLGPPAAEYAGQDSAGARGRHASGLSSAVCLPACLPAFPTAIISLPPTRTQPHFTPPPRHHLTGSPHHPSSAGPGGCVPCVTRAEQRASVACAVGEFHSIEDRIPSAELLAGNYPSTAGTEARTTHQPRHATGEPEVLAAAAAALIVVATTLAGRTYYYYGKACARAPRASQPPDLLRAPTRRATATRRTRLADACLTTRAHGSESDGTVCAQEYSYVTCRLTALSDGSVLRPERSRPARLALALPRFMAPLETYAVSGREGWQACRARATSTLLGVDPNTLRWTAGFRIHAGPKIFSRTASDSCRIHRYGYLDTPF